MSDPVKPDVKNISADEARSDAYITVGRNNGELVRMLAVGPDETVEPFSFAAILDEAVRSGVDIEVQSMLDSFALAAPGLVTVPAAEIVGEWEKRRPNFPAVKS